MALTSAQFAADYPQFAETSPTQIERALTRAALRINEAKYGALYDEAHGALAAHILAVSSLADLAGGASTGPIKRIDVEDDYVIEFGGGSGESKSGLESTSYGQQFLEIQRLVILPINIL